MLKANYIKALAIASLTILSFNIHGQIYTGGSVGVHFDKGYYVEAAPVVGYRYKRVDMGLSPFLSYRERQNQPDFYSFGNRIYTQITIIPQVFGHAEFEVSNIEVAGRRKWIMGLPVGGGYRYKLSKNAEAYGMILYDVLLDKDSPVQNPIIRGGVNYRF
jgi:hypothetical protein